MKKKEIKQVLTKLSEEISNETILEINKKIII
jgi:glycine betaine/choline ABC-type transport system substrate-binding protein